MPGPGRVLYISKSTLKLNFYFTSGLQILIQRIKSFNAFQVQLKDLDTKQRMKTWGSHVKYMTFHI